MSRFALGLMSGTSGDGVSLALADFIDRKFRILGYNTYPYEKSLSKRVTSPANLSFGAISSLNFELGHIFADACVKFLKELRVAFDHVAVIGSHGQTIFHAPSGTPPSTFQIGESAVIAERTGVTVVSNFRERDISAGGEGAPLIPFFDQYAFGQGSPRLMLNLGGIANVTLAGKNLSPIAYDTGPGNCLMDWAASRASKGRHSCDKGGNLARQGIVDMKAVAQMMQHPYFSKKPPKSTGREIFNEGFIPARLKNSDFKNILATLTFFTAQSIYLSCKKHILTKSEVDEIIVSGGGVFNRTLMGLLGALFNPIKVIPISEYGMHPQAKEPLAFAYFAWQAVRGQTNHLPEGTGAKTARVLGKITPGNNFKGIR